LSAAYCPFGINNVSLGKIVVVTNVPKTAAVAVEGIINTVLKSKARSLFNGENPFATTINKNITTSSTTPHVRAIPRITVKDTAS
jgi:hypothetical protein